MKEVNYITPVEERTCGGIIGVQTATSHTHTHTHTGRAQGEGKKKKKPETAVEVARAAEVVLLAQHVAD